MSSEDIIYILKNDFLVCKDKGVEASTKIKNVYEELFKSYDCFTKPEISMKFPSSAKTSQFVHKNAYSGVHHKYDKMEQRKNVNKYNNHYQNNYHNHNSKTPINVGKPRKPLFTRDDLHGEAKAKLQGFLNIINKDNFHKISTKIKSLINDENCKTMFDIILVMACSQVYYIDIFIHLIRIILNNASEIQQNICIETINQFIDSFVFNKEYVYHKNSIIENSDYDDFCLQQKHKSIVTSKNIVIIELLKNKYSQQWTLQTYIDTIVYSLNDINKGQNDMNVKIFIIDVILSILKDIKTRSKTVRIDCNTLSNVLNCNYNQRITFIIQDIINMEWNN
jgi:hypothetical protein